MLIHSAQTSDIPALSALARETFTETFGYLYAPEDLSAFLDKYYSETALALALEQDEFWRIVYDDYRNAIAYIHAGPVGLPHIEADPERQGEIKRLYVRQSAQGAGLGKRLLDLGLDYMNARYGAACQWIGVWSENHRAQKLYGRYGFKRVGDYGFKVGKTVDFEFILRRWP